MIKDKPVTFVISGCGARGRTFSNWINEHPEYAKVIAIAEPNVEIRKLVSQQHDIPEEKQFEDWEELLNMPRMADAVINTTMDKIHAPSSIKALNLKYHLLLEKPMATNLKDCALINETAKKNDRIVSICHLLRYTDIFRELKRLISGGVIGDIISLDLLEGVDLVRHSHSFVRGNWSNVEESSFMLLTKSCHDVDMIAWLIDKPCKSVSSFGSLSHFRKEKAPENIPLMCDDGCPLEKDCPYSAYKIYVEGGIFADRVMKGKTKDERLELIKTGSYGRCVYYCDNDTVDHQVVNFEFDDNITATFTMTAFTPGGRSIRIHGTHGYIESNTRENIIKIDHFWGNKPQETIHIPGQKLNGYGVGDDNTMKNFIQAVQSNDPGIILTNAEESLHTHAIAFAAEKARLEKRVVEIKELFE
jgi:predicted dehydrogenase